ncbi:hypothetical protein [Actinoplanes sp. L3-i22]|uniref:hypothetical protein n=1 Tax=Actinoplanes sp. L3-i22 TaxID=2836373 RepID=UPI001C7652A1|nr:hypothetical protein [Actinoplanes sp. L3-i22]BCY08077.1 hypothetical protein L3i22_031650 [Actinoplanes sp. L3-i22]
MGSLDWDVLDERARGGDADGVRDMLCAAAEPERVAFLILAARPTPFAAEVGRDLADLVAHDLVKLGRVAVPLSDAHRAGASRAVWELLLAALPTLIPLRPRGLPGVLELGTRVAVAVGAHDDLPELASVRGGARLTAEAKRLRAVLVR